MKNIAESVLALLNKDDAAIKAAMINSNNGITVYPASLHKLGNAAVMMARDENERFIIVVAVRYDNKLIDCTRNGHVQAIGIRCKFADLIIDH